MKRIKTLALVLRRTNYGEADRIVNLLTPAGKVVAMAKGARRQKSRLAGGIEVFSLNEVVLLEGKGEMRTLASARMRDFFGEIIKDFDRAEFGYLAIKQISARAENIENREFFDILLQTFVALNSPEVDLDLIKKWFALRLSVASGEDLNLAIDSSGEPLSAAARYDFDPVDKVFVQAELGEFDQNHIKFLRLMMSSEPRIIAKINGWRAILGEIARIIEIMEGK